MMKNTYTTYMCSIIRALCLLTLYPTQAAPSEHYVVLSADQYGTNITRAAQQLITIRNYTPDDYEAVMSIAQENAYWLNGDQGVAQLISEQECTTIVCLVNNVIVGFIIYDLSEQDGRLFGGIRYMAITSSARSGGFGSLLLNEALLQLEQYQVQAVYLSVKIDNQRAIRFYESFGFHIISENHDLAQYGMCRPASNFAPFIALQGLVSLVSQ